MGNTVAKRNRIYFLLSIVVSILLIWYLFTYIELKDLFYTLSNTYLPSLYIYFFISLIGVLARAYRYDILIASGKIKIGSLLLVTLVRNLFVDLFPAKLGSLSYVYILNKRFNFPFEIATSTFLLAFVFDFIAVVPLLIIAILMLGIGTTPISSPLIFSITGLIFLLLLLLLFNLTWVLRILLSIVGWVLRKLRLKKNERIDFLLKKLIFTIDAVEEIKKRKIYWKVFFYSIAIRILKYSGIYFLLHSVLAYKGFTIANLNFWKVFLGSSGAELSALMPIHGIAGFGTWETAWAFTFQLLGFDLKLAIISGFATHLISQIFAYSLGILSILILSLPLLSKKRKFSKTPLEIKGDDIN